jgi:enoyl-CoA hydratase
MTEGLEIEYDGGVLRLTLNRPERLNALSADMADRLAEEVEAVPARDDVRVVLPTGAGGAFCSGADLSGADVHESFDVSSLDRANRIVRAVTALDKPVVAAVRGGAAGVGCSMALA